MAVKLDILINYLFDNTKLKKGIADLNKQMISAWSPYTRQNILNMGQRGNLREYLDRLRISAKQFNDILANTKSQITALNKYGHFQPLLESMGITSRKNLNKQDVDRLANQLASQQVTELQAVEENKQTKFEQNIDSFMAKEKELFEADLRAKKEKDKIEKRLAEIKDKEDMASINEKSKLDAKLEAIKEKQQAEYWNTKIKWEKREAQKQARADEKRKKDMFNLMLGRWGKFGLWGIAVAKAIQYASKGLSYAYSTSMEGLDWQRTISGGASGGEWFGKGLAGYQRAGIGKANYQNFKRGIQSYLGQVKLGTGNAAPLMWLGLNALSDPDEIERQMERALRRAPKDESLAMAGMMGLDYNMWEAIYSGRIDRERSAYSKEAMKAWADLANSLNDLMTNLNTFFFNNLAPLANLASKFLDKILNKGSSWSTASSSTGFLSSIYTGGINLGNLGYALGQFVRFGAVEIIVKNENGEVVDRKFSEAGMEYKF